MSLLERAVRLPLVDGPKTPGFETHHVVRARPDQLDVVRRHQNCASRGRESTQDRGDLQHVSEVQTAGRLVEDHSLTSRGERGADRQALLLAAGECQGMTIRALAQIDSGQDLIASRAHIRLCDARKPQGHLDLVRHGFRHQLVIDVLEDEKHPPAALLPGERRGRDRGR